MLTFLWIAFVIIVGVAASTRNRSSFGWVFVIFLISLLLVLFSPLLALISPLLAGMLLLALPRKALIAPDLVACPFCCELIKNEAKICKHCHRQQPELQAKKSPELQAKKMMQGSAFGTPAR